MSETQAVMAQKQTKSLRPIAQFDPVSEVLRVFYSEPYVIYEVDGQRFEEWLRKEGHLSYVMDYNDSETGEHRQTKCMMDVSEFYEFYSHTEVARIAEDYIKEYSIKPVRQPFLY